MIVPLPADVRDTIRSGVAITTVSQCAEELVLNSLDSGASCVALRLDLDIGKLQVVDNGCGIDEQDLQRIGDRYMTSKCKNVDDLKNLIFHGFRGEALASIVSMSERLEIQTRRQNTYKKTISNDEKRIEICEDRRPSVGTTVTVYGLFDRFPVRRKSIEPSLEKERIVSLLQSLSLAYHQVTFSFRDDVTGSVIFLSRRHGSVANAFKTLFGSQIQDDFYEVTIGKEDIEVRCHISRERYTDKSLQFVYLNHRRILKSIIHDSMNEFLVKFTRNKDSITRVRTMCSVFIIQVKCPLTDFDISFNPRKTFVEFHDWKTVKDCLRKAVDRFLLSEGLDGIEKEREISENPEVNIEPLEIRLDGLNDTLFSKPAVRPKIKEKPDDFGSKLTEKSDDMGAKLTEKRDDIRAKENTEKSDVIVESQLKDVTEKPEDQKCTESSNSVERNCRRVENQDSKSGHFSSLYNSNWEENTEVGEGNSMKTVSSVPASVRDSQVFPSEGSVPESLRMSDLVSGAVDQKGQGRDCVTKQGADNDQGAGEIVNNSRLEGSKSAQNTVNNSRPQEKNSAQKKESDSNEKSEDGREIDRRKCDPKSSIPAKTTSDGGKFLKRRIKESMKSNNFDLDRPTNERHVKKTCHARDGNARKKRDQVNHARILQWIRACRGENWRKLNKSSKSRYGKDGQFQSQRPKGREVVSMQCELPTMIRMKRKSSNGFHSKSKSAKISCEWENPISNFVKNPEEKVAASCETVKEKLTELESKVDSICKNLTTTPPSGCLSSNTTPPDQLVEPISAVAPVPGRKITYQHLRRRRLNRRRYRKNGSENVGGSPIIGEIGNGDSFIDLESDLATKVDSVTSIGMGSETRMMSGTSIDLKPNANPRLEQNSGSSGSGAAMVSETTVKFGTSVENRICSASGSRMHFGASVENRVRPRTGSRMHSETSMDNGIRSESGSRMHSEMNVDSESASESVSRIDTGASVRIRHETNPTDVDVASCQNNVQGFRIPTIVPPRSAAKNPQSRPQSTLAARPQSNGKLFTEITTHAASLISVKKPDRFPPGTPICQKFPGQKFQATELSSPYFSLSRPLRSPYFSNRADLEPPTPRVYRESIVVRTPRFRAFNRDVKDQMSHVNPMSMVVEYTNRSFCQSQAQESVHHRSETISGIRMLEAPRNPISSASQENPVERSEAFLGVFDENQNLNESFQLDLNIEETPEINPFRPDDDDDFQVRFKTPKIVNNSRLRRELFPDKNGQVVDKQTGNTAIIPEAAWQIAGPPRKPRFTPQRGLGTCVGDFHVWTPNLAEIVRPNSEIVRPDSEIMRPESEIVRPDSEIMPSNSEIVRPDLEIVRADSEIVRPDSEIMRPDSEIVRPDSEIVRPDSEIVRPDSEIVRPDSEILLPDSEILRPYSAIVRPDSKILRPDFEIVRPDSEIVRPDSETVQPNSSAEFFGAQYAQTAEMPLKNAKNTEELNECKSVRKLWLSRWKESENCETSKFADATSMKTKESGNTGCFPEEKSMDRKESGNTGCFPEEKSMDRKESGNTGCFPEEKSMDRKESGNTGCFPEEKSMDRKESGSSASDHPNRKSAENAIDGTGTDYLSKSRSDTNKISVESNARRQPVSVMDVANGPMSPGLSPANILSGIERKDGGQSFVLGGANKDEKAGENSTKFGENETLKLKVNANEGASDVGGRIENETGNEENIDFLCQSPEGVFRNLEDSISEIVVGGRQWLVIEDSLGRCVYIDPVSGNSRLQRPITPVLGSVDTAARAGNLTYSLHPVLSYGAAQFKPRTKEERTLKVCDAEEIDKILSSRERNIDNEMSVKWRVVSKEGVENVKEMLLNWTNPVFEPVRGVMDISNSCHSSLSRVCFMKQDFQNLEVLSQVDEKFIACILNSVNSCGRRLRLLVLIDQHAAHERIRLEILHDNLMENDNIRSVIITPIKFNFPLQDLNLLMTYRSKIVNLGLDFQISEREVIVSKVPYCYTYCDRQIEVERDKIESLLKELIETCRNCRGAFGTLPQRVQELLWSQACHGAIKFGDKLTLTECSDLIKSLGTCRLPFQCAHGRPSLVPLLDMNELYTKMARAKLKPNLKKVTRMMRQIRHCY